jgi:predicted HicB family RNase H-like nuclease
MSDEKKLSVRVEPDLAGKIETAAAAERRSVSNMVRCVLADWAAARELQGKAA